MIQYIIKVPENTQFDLLSQEVQDVITSVKGQFPSGVLVGSQAVLGYELKLVMADIEPAVFADILLNGYTFVDANGVSQTIDLLLDWEILADETSVVDQTLILPYIADVPVFDVDGNQTGVAQVTDLTGRIQTYAGHNWLY